jgi:hypothetical protein
VMARGGGCRHQPQRPGVPARGGGARMGNVRPGAMLKVTGKVLACAVAKRVSMRELARRRAWWSGGSGSVGREEETDNFKQGRARGDDGVTAEMRPWHGGSVGVRTVGAVGAWRVCSDAPRGAGRPGTEYGSNGVRP